MAEDEGNNTNHISISQLAAIFSLCLQSFCVNTRYKPVIKLLFLGGMPLPGVTIPVRLRISPNPNHSGCRPSEW